MKILFLCALGLPACGGEIVAPHFETNAVPPANPSLSVQGLQILRLGEDRSREILAGVYPGDVVPLTIRGNTEEIDPQWTSSNTSKGIVSSEGVLQILLPGEFTIAVRVGSLSQNLRVKAGDERPYLGAAPASPSPSPSATPSESPLPTPTPNPTPTPSPSPSGEDPPPAIPSDPFADEVTSFDAGEHAGFGLDQFPNIVLGPPQGNGAGLGGFHVLSLGVGGEIVLKSATPILNAPGKDFIVFENAFYVGGNPMQPFAEPGEVAVSRDGETFFTFSCAADRPEDVYPGCAGVHPVYANPLTNFLDPTDPETAGGDAFDLEEVDLSWARYVRIRDQSTSGGGNSAGFDLDAIAIIHQ